MSENEVQTGRETGYKTPAWVKTFGIIALLLAVLIIGIMLFGGEHGPGRHIPSATATEIHVEATEQ
jgi:hypothetical protein